MVTYTPIYILVGALIFLFIVLAIRRPQAVSLAKYKYLGAKSEDFRKTYAAVTSIQTMVPFLIFTVIGLWVLNFILSNVLQSMGYDLAVFKIGWIFFVMALGALIFLVWKILYIGTFKEFYSAWQNWVTTGIIAAVIIALLIFLPWLVPSLFSVAMAQINMAVMSVL